MYVQVACPLEMSWRIKCLCIYAYLPLELAVFVCRWASTMILLFDMWTENVAYHDGEKVSSLSGQYVNGEGTCVHFKIECPT